MSKDPFEKEEHIQNPFRNSRGAFRTYSLFFDINYDPEIAMYTLKDYDMEKDGKVFPSLKRLYLEAGDPTEYTFATTYLEGWPHWQAILNSKDMYNRVQEWREELEIKLRSQAIKSIYNQALDPNKPSYQAAAFIADRKWVKRGAGAPSKEEIEGEKKKQAEISKDVEEHLSRMEQFH